MKVFVLGLDGATFDIINPLMEEDVIPNIKSLLNNGATGPLQTVFPPVTAPAWLSLATGLNPGKTGVFDYINRTRAESETFVPISSKYYEKRAIWDYLNEEGLRVGIFNYPTLSPPPQVNGFAVSGMEGKKGNMCFPTKLEAELDEVTNGYESRLNLRNPKYKKSIDLFFEDINRIIKKQALALKHLVQTQEWDFFFAVFSFTDWMGHVLWKDIDERHPLYDPRTSPDVKVKFEDAWRKIDTIIGELLNILPNDTNFIIVSDHGMGPLESVFFPNVWIERKGWLKKKNLGWKRFLIENVKFFSEGSDNKYYNAFLHFLRSKILKINGTIDLIDLKNSWAYSPEHNTMFGCINLTQKGKKIDGFKEQLIQEVKNLPRNIEGIERVQVYLPEEIYSGPYINLSPDIFFVLNDYKSTVEIDFSNKPFVPSPSIEMRTGGHQTDGVFFAKGASFKNIAVQDVSILDITPTVMALYDLEVSSEFDGKVLTECIRPEVLESMNIRFGKDEEVSHSQRKAMEEGDLEEMKSMLKSLGYM